MTPRDFRMTIARGIAESLQDKVDGVYVGGSLGLGEDSAVTDSSDIDMVVVLDTEHLDSLLATHFFQGAISEQVATLFKNDTINLFWLTKELSAVEVNVFFYERCAFKDFCLTKGDIKGAINHQPSVEQKNYGFAGELLTFSRNPTLVSGQYFYSKPALANGRYWGGPPRQDFFYGMEVLYEKNSFFTELEPLVWQATIKRLVNEYGFDVDLNKNNILNTHYTYQTKKERFPQKIIDLITTRTREELNNYLCS